MKKIITLFLVLLAFAPVKAQLLESWTKTFPLPTPAGSGVMVEGAPVFDASNNVYFTGWENTDSSLFFAKADPMGNVIWKQYYNRQPSIGYQRPLHLEIDGNGDLLLCVWDLSTITDEDMTLLKFDQDGNRLWTYTYATMDVDRPKKMLVDAAGNTYVAMIVGPGGEDQHLLKISPGGVLLIDSLYASYNIGYDTHDFQFVPGGGFLITLRYYDAASNLHSVLRKFDASFNTLWVRDLTNYVFLTIATDAAGNIITAGNDSMNWHGPLSMKKYDPSGNLLWSQSYPALGVRAASYDLLIDNAGNRYLNVNTNAFVLPDAYTMKFDNTGAFVWSYQVQNPGWQCEFARHLNFLPDGSLLQTAFRETGASNTQWNIIELTHLDVNGNPLGLIAVTHPHSSQMEMSYTGVNPSSGEAAVMSVIQGLGDFQLTKVCSSGECKPNIGGTVFIDANTNCTWGSGEIKIPGRMISVNNGQYYSITDVSGNYLMHQPPGTYTITENIPAYWYETCPGTVTATLTTAIDSSMHNDFGNQFTPNVVDLSVFSNISVARPGFNQYSVIHYDNPGTLTQNATVSLDLDPVFDYQNAIPAPSLVSGNHYEWSISSLAPSAGGNIIVYSGVNSLVPIGTIYSNTVQITAAGTDIYLANNMDGDSGVVYGAYDPNNKTVSPSGIILPADSVLTYTVNFQNTGTDTAFTVQIVDTLSANLDLLTFHVLCSSHPVRTEVYGHTLRFTFDNILLADSNTNEALSHGFICFSLEQKQNLAPGTIIANVADIYFDFNAPVITNNAADTLANPAAVAENSSGRSLSIYPNPVHDKFNLDLGNETCHVSIQLFDLAGKMIRQQELEYVPGQSVISMDGIAAGAYMLKVQGPDFSGTIKVIRQ